MSAPRVLLVGLGRWGEKHLRVLSEIGVEIWVADVSAERRAYAVRARASTRRAWWRITASALPHVDAVDLVTPADSHLALAAECLRAGKHCFVEKPLAATRGEGRALAGAVRRDGARAAGRPHLPLPPGHRRAPASNSRRRARRRSATARAASPASSARAPTSASP